MELFDTLKKTISNGVDKGINITKFYYKREKLFNEYNKITDKKTRVKEKATGKKYYLWIVGDDCDNKLKFEKLYILGMWEEILDKITPENIDNIDILNDLSTSYCYDDIIYTNGGFTNYSIVTVSNTLDFDILPNETSVTNRLGFHKNIYLDPIFYDEFQNWKNNFLPDKYISVKLDFYNTVSDPETASVLKQIVNTKDYPIHWMYVKDNYLCIQMAVNNLAELKGMGGHHPFDESEIQKYKLEDVKCFITYGDIEKTTTINGGEVSGGGTDIAGALIGGALFGDVGAIVGSRKPIESTPISTNVNKIDNRVVRILIKDVFLDLLPEGAKIYNQSKKEKDSSTLAALSFLMPEKDFRLLSLKNQTIVEKEDEFLKIEKLNELFKKGIITEEEYKNKKTELLNKI